MKYMQLVIGIWVSIILSSCVDVDEELGIDFINTDVPLVLFAGDSIHIPMRLTSSSLEGQTIETNYGKIVNDTMLVLTNNGDDLGKKLIQLKIPGVDSCEFPINVISEKRISVGDTWQYEEVEECWDFTGDRYHYEVTLLSLTVNSINENNIVVIANTKYYTPKNYWDGEKWFDSLEILLSDTTYIIDIPKMNDRVLTHQNYSINTKEFVEQVLAARIQTGHNYGVQDAEYTEIEKTESWMEERISYFEKMSLEDITLEGKDFWSLYLRRKETDGNIGAMIFSRSNQRAILGIGIVSTFIDFFPSTTLDNSGGNTVRLLSMNGVIYNSDPEIKE